MAEAITNNLDLWSSALLTKSTAGRGSNGKLEAYGIKKLRELILELAVRGKLVPQDPNAEPASVLLEKIAKEKLRLIKEGKIKKEKPLSEIAEEEMDYELPSGWVFVRLGDIAYSQAGFAFKSNFFNENSVGLPLIRIRDVGQPFTGTFYSGEYREEFLIEKGDYLISMDGEFRVSPWTNGTALLNQRVSRLIFYYENVGQRFIADSLQARLRELQGVKAYTTVDHLSGTQITEAVIGLPPLAEQHRIVAKVDELMALCDQLEQQQTHSIAAHQTTVETLLGTLSRVGSQQEFSAAWARIASHFDTLFTTEASIDALKQSLLQFAYSGRLCESDMNSWHDISLSEITEAVVDIDHKMPKAVNEGVIFLSAKDLKDDGTLDFSQPKYISREDFQRLSRRIVPRKGDIIYSRIGARLGKARLVNVDTEFLVSYSCCVIRPNEKLVSKEFLVKFLDSRLALDQAHLGKQSIGVPDLGLGVIKGFKIPLPTLDDQHRIVAKVDELMALCDALKARLADAQTIQLHLADAIVEQAVA